MCICVIKIFTRKAVVVNVTRLTVLGATRLSIKLFKSYSYQRVPKLCVSADMVFVRCLNCRLGETAVLPVFYCHNTNRTARMTQHYGIQYCMDRPHTKRLELQKQKYSTFHQRTILKNNFKHLASLSCCQASIWDP
jgi:hypothetical protein